VVATATGTGISAGLAYMMFTQLPRYCPLCSATHILAALLLILSILLWPRRQPQVVAAVSDEGEHELTTAPETARAVSGPTVWKWPTAGYLVAALLLGVSLSVAGWSEYHRRLSSAYAADYKARWMDYE